MNIVDLVVFILGCTGLTTILVSSEILAPVRGFITNVSSFLGKMVNCSMCLGFWVGLVASFYSDINPIWGASISSLVSWSVTNIVEAVFAIGFYFDSMLESGEEDERSVE